MSKTATIFCRPKSSVPDLFRISPPPPAQDGGRSYEVFVSFRGEDTRRGFTSHLCDSLSSKLGISLVYKDEFSLDKGDYISEEILTAIEQSKIAVVVLSKNFASSSWCLDELVHILLCRERRDLRVIPIFYEVDPCDIRKQTRGSSFGEALAQHEARNVGDLKLQRWRNALAEVANLSGFATASYRNDSDMIKEIVGKIWKDLSPFFPSISKHLVGIDRRTRAVIDLLQLGVATNENVRKRKKETYQNNVCIVGICGIGGSGKTTVAMAVYDEIRPAFQFHVYLAHVREVSAKKGIFHLQKQLFNEIAGNAMTTSIMDVWPEVGGIERLKRVFKGKRLLLVVDDVTTQKQLQYLAVEHSSFGMGSRIVITSRDQHVLKAQKVDHVYETELLGYDEASVLLSREALEQDEPVENYKEVCKHLVGYAGGLPLALEVLGSSLRGRSVTEWHSTFEKLKRIPPGEILEVLKVSYDVLDQEEKEMFLDVVFFFKGQKKGYVVSVLEHLYLGAEIGMRNLIDKALLIEGSECDGSKLSCTHDMVEEMGKSIVRSDCRNKPGQQSRLMGYEDVSQVLSEETGTENVKAISLRLDVIWPKSIGCSREAFSKMTNLRLLELTGLQILQEPNYLYNELRVLTWTFYPSESLPSSFNPHSLVTLCLDDSYNLKQIWQGNKTMQCLRYMILKGCKNLIATSDFSETPNLEFLDMEDCESLLEVHQSFGQLKRLDSANFRRCKSLKLLPTTLETNSLELLILEGCTELIRFPDIEGNLDSRCELRLDGCCKLEELPPSLQRWDGLRELRVQGCDKLRSLPVLPPRINRVSANGCISLRCIPDTINLQNGLHMECFGCFKLDEPESLAWRILKRYLQGVPHPVHKFTVLAPARPDTKFDIPDWLADDQLQGDISTEDWIGIVAVVCFDTNYRSPCEPFCDGGCSFGTVLGSVFLPKFRVAEDQVSHVYLLYTLRNSVCRDVHELDFEVYVDHRNCSHLKPNWWRRRYVFRRHVEVWKEHDRR